MLAVISEDPDPIIFKIFKKGSELPIKDLRGRTEVMDLLEIIEDNDLGTYIIEFINTSAYLQDFSFIIKQIELNMAEPSGVKKVSVEEKRMYEKLETANHEIKHFEVE